MSGATLLDGRVVEAEPVVVSPSIPVVSMARALIAMERAGISEQAVVDAIETIPDEDQRTETRIWFARATEINRSHPAVALLAPLLGLTEEQVDDLFLAAAAIPAA